MLIAANAQLQEKQAALKAIEDKVAALEQALAAAEAEQARLKEQASVTAARLQRAAKLTSGLQEEGVRWGKSARQIKVSLLLFLASLGLLRPAKSHALLIPAAVLGSLQSAGIWIT